MSLAIPDGVAGGAGLVLAGGLLAVMAGEGTVGAAIFYYSLCMVIGCQFALRSGEDYGSVVCVFFPNKWWRRCIFSSDDLECAATGGVLAGDTVVVDG